MRRKVGSFVREKKPADNLIEIARTKLHCSVERLFVLAFSEGTREQMKAAYRRYQEKGTLVAQFRNFLYKVLHGLMPTVGTA
jgi:hypothetical protein